MYSNLKFHFLNELMSFYEAIQSLCIGNCLVIIISFFVFITLIVVFSWLFFLRFSKVNQFAKIIFEGQEAIVITDKNGILLTVNQSFVEITGYREDEVIGKDIKILRSEKQDDDFYIAMWNSLKEKGTWRGEIWNKKKNGELFAEWLVINSIKNVVGKTTHYIGTFLDITEQKLNEERIRRLAFYDNLTGLLNRKSFVDRLEKAIEKSHISRSFGAVLFIDLDNFKDLNDTRGHYAGDILLQQASARLLRSVREEDFVARFGGDEFVVLLENLSGDLDRAKSMASLIGKVVNNKLAEPYVFEDFTHFCSSSIGISMFQGLEKSLEDVMKCADSAMYQAKAAGRNAVKIYNSEMQMQLEEKIKLAEELRLGLKNNQLALYFQPQITSNDLKVQGAEVLLRWEHPKRGLLSANDFIQLAEKRGLIYELGDWVLEKTCELLSKWQETSEMKDLTLSVNISAKQFDRDDFINTISNLINKYKLSAGLLILEITESMKLKDIDRAIKKIQYLRGLGVKFSLDDFGTGYSSLSYLTRLPIDEVKVDRSFIQNINLQPTNQELLRSIIALSNALSLQVIGEGVETQEEVKTLLDMSCYTFQGNFYAQAMPLAEFKEFVASKN